MLRNVVLDYPICGYAQIFRVQIAARIREITLLEDQRRSLLCIQKNTKPRENSFREALTEKDMTLFEPIITVWRNMAASIRKSCSPPPPPPRKTMKTCRRG